MSTIAIFVGNYPPSLADIPFGCWAEKRTASEAWTIISTGTKGAIASIAVTAGGVTRLYNWEGRPAGARP